MKRIIALLLSVVLLFACGCQDSNVTTKTDKVQYVLAFNPSIMLEDGTIDSIRNDVASSMQTDMKAGSKTAFYEDTSWQWIYRDAEGEWNQRLVRSLTSWSDAAGNTKANAPYSYKMSDDGSFSLAVYDSSKMDIKGVDGVIGNSGIIMSFSGDDEEGICYTASEDCYIEFSDRTGGAISIVDSIYGMSTSFLNQKNAKNAVVIRVYKNNRIYWQEVIGNDNTAVTFPTFTGIDLLKGDSIIVTAEPVDDTSTIICGNCDIPTPTKTVLVDIPNESLVPVIKPETPVTEVPFVVDAMANFSIVRPDVIEQSTKEIIDSFVKRVETKLEIYPDYITDYIMEDDASRYFILIGKTECEESKSALDDIKKARTNYAADFIIRQTGNKIVIAADNDYALNYAIEFFFNNYCKDDESVIDAGLNYVSSKYNAVSDIKLAGKPITDYRIVHSPYYTFMEADAVDYLVNYIVKKTGKIINVVDDKQAKADYEILIGDTNRTSTNYYLSADLGGEEKYTISVGNKVTSVTSRSNSAVNAGVMDLVGKLSKGNVTVGTYNGTYDGSYSLTSGYKLAWTEDFTGDKLSKTWKFKDADGYDTLHNGITHGVMENAVVKEGLLNAKIYRDAKNDIYGVSIASDGANSMAFKYGYIEGRIKLPTAKGYSAALWAVTYSGALGSGEFDIFENASQVDSVKPNLHAWLPGNHLNILGGTSSVENYGSVKLSIGENYYEKFHNFGMEWTDDYIKFYIDGKCRFTFDTTTSTDYNVFDQYANVCLCFFADEEWCKVPLADGDNENCAYVDWIRVWQKDEAGYGIKVK